MVDDRFPNDPFFKRGPDFRWNACIGTQGDEENYLEGYIEAATELASAIIEKDMPGKRDTLVLPILYNARHAIELVLKFVIRRFSRDKLVRRELLVSHDIALHWNILDEAQLGDRALRAQIAAIKPFIDSLAAIDKDGQELRYHLNTSDDPSLAGYSLANLEVIRDSLKELASVISDLRYRAIGYLEERTTGTFTTECSRFDLLAIAKTMPPLISWNEKVFDEKKEEVKAVYGLSGKAFSRAIVTIKSTREMRAILGEETSLLYITDDQIEWALGKWAQLLDRERKSGFIDAASREAWAKGADKRRRLVGEIAEGLTSDQLADLHTVYHLGRDRWFSEFYEERLKSAQREFEVTNNHISHVVYLFDKTNLKMSLARGLPKLGRLSLTRKLVLD